MKNVGKKGKNPWRLFSLKALRNGKLSSILQRQNNFIQIPIWFIIFLSLESACLRESVERRFLGLEKEETTISDLDWKGRNSIDAEINHEKIVDI